MKDVFCSLNELDFIGQTNPDLFEKMKCVKQRLVIELEDCNLSKLKYVSNFSDDMKVLIITNELKDFVEKNNSLWENILYLISFISFIENAEEVVVEQNFSNDKSKPWN